MNPATTLATKLRARNITVLRVAQPTEDEDGAVYLSKHVYVQVPTFGGSCNVVHRQPGDVFQFYPDRSSIEALAKDIETALAADLIIRPKKGKK